MLPYPSYQVVLDVVETSAAGTGLTDPGADIHPAWPRAIGEWYIVAIAIRVRLRCLLPLADAGRGTHGGLSVLDGCVPNAREACCNSSALEGVPSIFLITP